MRRCVSTLAAVSALVFALGASPAMASPVLHGTFPAAGEVIVCGTHTYTFTSGSFFMVARDPSIAAHMTLNQVRAVDQDGKPYRVVGAETYDDAAGRIVSKVMFIGQGGGIVDSVNIVAQDDPSRYPYFSFGTCGF
jgi:hypothetical protein